MSLEKLYQKIILDYASDKANKREIPDATAVERGHNSSCGDDITIVLKVKDNVIDDISFLGNGCAISTASTNMMIELTRGKSMEEAKVIVKTFFDMMAGKDVSEEELERLGDAQILEFVSTMPARIKCATLSWHSLKVLIVDH